MHEAGLLKALDLPLTDQGLAYLGQQCEQGEQSADCSHADYADTSTCKVSGLRGTRLV